MIIRAAQMEALAAACLLRFENATVRRIVETRSDIAAALGLERVQAIVHEGIRRAQTYGITGERTIGRFVDILFQLSPTFDISFSWSEKILTNPTLSAAEKMDRVATAVEYELAARSLG